MIKLRKIVKPDELEKNEITLTKKYRKTKGAVWQKEYITNALNDLSYGKYAYCEKCDKLEVEHFICRHKRPDKVVDWENLLPVCHTCNNNKSDHDCEAEPIINPRADNPKEHLIYDHYRFYPRGGDIKGRRTIAYLNLNDTAKTREKRENIFLDVEKAINACRDKYKLLSTSKELKLEKEELRKLVIEMFRYIRCENEFSALYATEILAHPLYPELKKELKASKVWNEKITQLEKNAIMISLS